MRKNPTYLFVASLLNEGTKIFPHEAKEMTEEIVPTPVSTSSPQEDERRNKFFRTKPCIRLNVRRESVYPLYTPSGSKGSRHDS